MNEIILSIQSYGVPVAVGALICVILLKSKILLRIRYGGGDGKDTQG